jgi:uncharacterized membrane protein
MMQTEDDAGRVARAERMWSGAFRVSLFIIAIQLAAAAYFARAIWSLNRVPMHWNAAGQIDRWGAGREAALILFVLPAVSAFTMAILRFASMTGPRREGLAATPRLLASVFIAVPLLLLGVVVMIGSGMVSRAPWGPSLWQGRVILAAAGLLVAGLGNFLGKTRRNWWMGVRTPWSLESDLAWAKSNRLAGRLMVVTGLCTVLAAAALDVRAAAFVLAGGSIVMATASVFTSWWVWRRDPDRTA